jgi:hypothetical protein
MGKLAPAALHPLAKLVPLLFPNSKEGPTEMTDEFKKLIENDATFKRIVEAGGNRAVAALMLRTYNLNVEQLAVLKEIRDRLAFFKEVGEGMVKNATLQCEMEENATPKKGE